MSYYGSTCSGQNKRSCLCQQANVSCLDRVEGDGFRKGRAGPEACPASCQCVEEAAWNKTIPPKPNCEWLSNFKELRRQWSNHSRQQSCRCYGCSSYRCRSCLAPLPSYSGADALSPKDCQDCCPPGWTRDSRTKEKSTSGCSLSNYSTPVRNFQNSRIYRPLESHRSCSPSRRPILRRGLCSQCIPECCFCQSPAKNCNCAASVRENSQDERDCCSECSPPSRERTFPRNKIESTDKLNCPRCHFQGPKCQCCKCESVPPCGQCGSRRSKANDTKINCCSKEDSDTCSNRSKPICRPKSARHKTTETFFEESHVPQGRLGDDHISGTLTEIMKDDSCCCCNFKISKNRKEFIEQQCQNNKQNPLLPKNCFQCPICSSVLSSTVWKCSAITSPKLYNVKMENNVKFNCRQSKIFPNDSLHPDTSNFDLNSSVSYVESCKIDAISEQVTENCNEKIFHKKEYKSEEKTTFRNPALNIGHCAALNMNSTGNQSNANENLSCVKECKRYRKKRKKISCKFKLDQKDDISKPHAHFSNVVNNNQSISSQTSQNCDENSEMNKEAINSQDNSSELWNDENLNESSSEECVMHSR